MNIVSESGEILDDRYRLDSVLGSGATATVYRAKDERRGVWRAIKILHQNMALHEKMRKDSSRRDHGGAETSKIVRVHATGSSKDGTYIVMDLVTGGTLQEQLENEGKMEPRLATSVLQQMLQGLHHAHEQGVVHRDLQPGNIMVETDSTPRLVDFGIAVQIDHEEESSRGGMGTRGFVAPEQLQKGLAVDHRADIYGAGATLLAMLTGKSWESVHSIEPDGPELEGVPQGLGEVIQKATRYRPEDRYQTAAEMGRALAQAHSKLHAKRPQEEPTIIIGDEDEDWAVLEQRRDFSEMEDAQSLPNGTESPPVESPPDSTDLWLRILAGFALVGGVVAWWFRYR